MNILFFSRALGGYTTNFIHNQVVDVSLHHNVLYVCLEHSKNEALGKLKIQQVPYEQNRVVGHLRKRLELHDLYINFGNSSFRKKLARIVADFKPSVIHAQFGYDALYLADNLPSISAPFVISFRGFDASLKLILETYVSRLRDLLSKPNVYTTFVCEHLKNNLTNKGIKLRNPHLILYSNTDVDFFKPLDPGVKNEAFTFIQISSFREKKGHEYTIRAFAKFVEKNRALNSKLILAGEGEGLYWSAKELVKKLGLQDKVEFVGWVDRITAKDLLAKSHVAVLHSVTDRLGDQEGIPNALMEAMAMELPVLSTYHSGIPELVEPGVNGFLVQERDIDGFAHAMSEAHAHWSTLPQNREKVIRKFEKKSHLDTLLSYYEFCVNDFHKRKSN